MSAYEDILYDVKGHVAVVTLNRPVKLNAWTAAMQASVKRAIVDAQADDAVRVIVVTGAGRGFCAGADMGNLQQIRPEKWTSANSPAPTRGSKRRSRAWAPTYRSTTAAVSAI